MQLLRATALAVTVAALALGGAACGGDDRNADEDVGAQTGAPAEGKQGGSLTFLAAADVDYVDPGQDYYQFGFMVQYAVNRPLYYYKPDDAQNPVPDLAEAAPEISEDQKRLTIRIRKGVRYAPPVDREVKAADVKYAIERAFTANVPSGYAFSYFSDIVGAPDKPGSYKEFEGLTTPDDYTLQIDLDKPSAAVIYLALSLPISVPVPKEYAQKFDRESPTDYDQYVAFTGPYMIRNDADGKLVGRDPGKRIEMVRNPNWSKETDYRPAYLDSITIEEGNDDLTVASRRALSGEGLMCCDAGQPPIPVLRQALTRNKDQLGRANGGGTRWIALNSTKEPFDNINVRKAIIAGLDRNALRLTRGGEFIGQISNHFIPPGVPGFEESGGQKGFTDVDFMQKPEGDPALARKYMLAAKADGVEGISDDGVYQGGDELLTIATNADPGLQTAQAFQGQIEKMGFKLNFRQVPQDTLYTKFCGVPKSNYAICPNVGWNKDFGDPQSLVQPTFSGDQILEQGNVNWSLLDDERINAAIEEASTLPVGDERNQAFADVNKMIVEQAVAIPYVSDDNFNVWSTNVQGVMNNFNANVDLSFTSLK